jgi:hypothetical protein
MILRLSRSEGRGILVRLSCRCIACNQLRLLVPRDPIAYEEIRRTEERLADYNHFSTDSNRITKMSPYFSVATDEFCLLVPRDPIAYEDVRCTFRPKWGADDSRVSVDINCTSELHTFFGITGS